MTKVGIRPWFHRLVDALPGPPIVSFGLIGLALAAANGFFVAGAVALGISTAMPRDVLVEALFGQLLAIYAVWASWYLNRSATADLSALRGVSAVEPDVFDRVVRSVSHLPARHLHVATALGVGLPFAVAGLVGGVNAPLASWGLFAFPDAAVLAMRTLLWAVLVPVLYLGVVSVAVFWRTGRDHVRVNLLELASLAPFARFGLRAALVLLAAAIFGFPGVVVEPAEWIPFVLSLPYLLLGLAGLVLPSWGLHGRIREAKRAELQRVGAALAGDVDALEMSPIGRDAARLRVVDLLAYRDRIEALREWPFDAAVLRRFGLYLLIPLGSWVGAALVERWVDRIF